MQISSEHSLARVKQAMAHAARVRRTSKFPRRAACLYIACRKWLGTW